MATVLHDVPLADDDYRYLHAMLEDFASRVQARAVEAVHRLRASRQGPKDQPGDIRRMDEASKAEVVTIVPNVAGVMRAHAACGLRRDTSPSLERFAPSSGPLADHRVALAYVVRSPLPHCAKQPRRQYAPATVPQGRAKDTPTDLQAGEETAPVMGLCAAEKALVIDAIADLVADAIWADCIGDFDSYGRFPRGKEP